MLKYAIFSPGTKVSAYADDVTAFIKTQEELNCVREHFLLYEQAAGAKLNEAKTECTWIGEEGERPSLLMEVKEEIKILGIYLVIRTVWLRTGTEKNLKLKKKWINGK